VAVRNLCHRSTGHNARSLLIIPSLANAVRISTYVLFGTGTGTGFKPRLFASAPIVQASLLDHLGMGMQSQDEKAIDSSCFGLSSRGVSFTLAGPGGASEFCELLSQGIIVWTLCTWVDFISSFSLLFAFPYLQISSASRSMHLAWNLDNPYFNS
jgi:hypothetical protein